MDLSPNHRYAVATIPYKRGHPNYRPLVTEIVMIGDHAIHGMDVETRQLRMLNRPVQDGSGRSTEVFLYPSLEEAISAAAELRHPDLVLREEREPTALFPEV